MRILLTTRSLDQPGGIQLYVRDVATGLLERGHTPVVHATRLGGVARKLADATVPVVDDLDHIGAEPDLIHGQYTLETLAALLRFPHAPAVFVCHSWAGRDQAPPIFPRVLRYVAVDEACRDRLLLRDGVPEARLRILLNFADLRRFQPRPPLPERPRRALLYSNYEPLEGSAAALEAACARLGIQLDRAGRAAGRVCEEPEKLLGRYDLVFSKGRSAIEALAVGCAVILWGIGCSGELVTPENFDRLRGQNFGRRALGRTATVERLLAEIGRYDAEASARVSDRIRSESSSEVAVDACLALYAEVLAESAGLEPDREAEEAAVARFLAAFARRQLPRTDAPAPSGWTRRLVRRLADGVDRLRRAAPGRRPGRRTGAARGAQSWRAP